MVVVNSYVLKASGITDQTKDPPGGSFDRDPDGMPNGVIREAARGLLRHFTERLGEPRVPFDEEVQAYLRWFREYSARGITSAGIAGGNPTTFRLYQAVRDAGGPVRMGFMFSEASFPALQAMGITSGLGDDRLRITAIKVFHGNSFSGRTCWLPTLTPTALVTTAFHPRARSKTSTKPSSSCTTQAFRSLHTPTATAKLTWC
jgi:predicted amidohydrolase YtcJ